MTKKKHKVLPAEMLDTVKYEIALELGLISQVQQEKDDDKLDGEADRGPAGSMDDKPSSSPNG